MSEKTVAFESPVDQAGFTIIENVILTDGTYSAGAKVTYLLFCYYAREDEKCWPGQDRLSQQVGVDGKTLRRYIAELEQHGLVRSIRRGLGMPNLYRVFRPFSNGRIPRHGSGESPEKQHPRNNNEEVLRTSSEQVTMFQDDPVLADVYSILSEAAQERGVYRPQERSLRKIIAEYEDQGLDPVAIAKDCAFWLTDGNGLRRQKVNIAQTYRNFMARAKPQANDSRNRLDEAANRIAERMGWN